MRGILEQNLYEGKIDRMQKFVKSGWAFPSTKCYFITKDWHVQGEKEDEA